jgi:hypothetical protein
LVKPKYLDNPDSQWSFVESSLTEIKGLQYCIKKALDELFPEGSEILVRLQQYSKRSRLTVMHCNGDGYVRAYMDIPGKRRFSRDFFYSDCQPISSTDEEVKP